nr:DUF418 domain-containing protein [Massilia sp. TS11]
MFALGLWVARNGWLQAPQQYRHGLRTAALAGLLGQLAMLAVAIVFHMLAAAFQWHSPLSALVFGLFGSVHTLGMVTIYVAGLTLLMAQPHWHARLAWLLPAGRMSLSVYLAQTVCGLLLFYGIGLGLVQKTPQALNLLLGALCFGALAWASRWWLARYRYGPLEWAWRSATALRPLPLKLS